MFSLLSSQWCTRRADLTVSAAYELFRKAANLKTVQERLGHADFTTTNRYLHLVEQADAEAVDSLEELYRKNTHKNKRPFHHVKNDEMSALFL